jgi:HTH-type transcriptional regulator/antitoxin HigA
MVIYVRANRRKATAYGAVPVPEMERRGWISRTSTVAALDAELSRFFEVEASWATVRNPERAQLVSALAWGARAMHLGRGVDVAPYLHENLDACEQVLRELASSREKVRRVAATLNSFGIRFLVVKPLAESRVDAGCLWLHPNEPLIVMSLLRDRIDAFWFSLMHQFSWVREGFRPFSAAEVLDERADGRRIIEEEDDDERWKPRAARILVPPEKVQVFLRTRPIRSKSSIMQFAQRLRVHPGIVLGELRSRGEVEVSAFPEMLVRVRHLVIRHAVTDGWGNGLRVRS